jgi:hypothetical protein
MKQLDPMVGSLAMALVSAIEDASPVPAERKHIAGQAIYEMLDELGFTPDELAGYAREMREVARRAKILRDEHPQTLQ